MKRTLLCLVTIGLLLMVANPLWGQRGPVMKGEAGEVQPPHPVRVVAEFLGLSEEQLELWVQLRGETQPELEMLRHEVSVLERQLQEELENEDAAVPVVGTLVLEIRARRAQFETIFRTRAEEFAAALDEEQQHRLSLIHRAAQVQSLLPAFRHFGLLP